MHVLTVQTPRGLRRVGPEEPVFVIAELSGNHNGDFGRALALVDAAIDAGADAIKLQTYTADTMTIECDAPPFRVEVNEAWSGRTLHELYEWAHTPWDWQPKLKAHAESRGALLFSSPFDRTAVDFLAAMDVALYKVASFELGDLALLRHVAQQGKPIILSRGLSSEADIARALETLRAEGAEQIALLHCVSSYPALPEQMNLRTIPDIAERFDVVPGLSDHTLGTTVALTSVGLGACIIEKHFTLDRSEGGPDAAFSLEPDELRALVEGVRVAAAALGAPTYEIREREAENLVFRRSLFVVADIDAGEALTSDNVRAIRPGYGLAPRHLDAVLGRTTSRAIARGTPLAADLIEGATKGEFA